MIYPEHEKLSKVKEQIQVIGEFLENFGYQLGEWITEGTAPWTQDHFVPVRKPINEVLAKYFEIDLDKLEAEKRAMLEELRKATEE